MQKDNPESVSKVVRLPPPKKGRVRLSKSMDAAGDLSLLPMYRRAEPIPDCVTRLFNRNWPERAMPERSPELLLALTVYGQLSKRKKESVHRMALHLAFEGDPSAGQLLNLLRGPNA
jgi:hypothetical protein